MTNAALSACDVREALAELCARLGRGAPPHAVGFGRKDTDGLTTRTEALRVYVTRKAPRDHVSRSDRFPPCIAGIPVDVIEEPVPVLHSDGVLTRRRRPVEMGDSISHELMLNGTMGAVVAWEGQPGRYLLSCAHVLAPTGLGRRRAFVLQPAVTDAGRVANNRIGRLAAWTSIRFGGEVNTVDAALAQIEPNHDAAVNEIGVPGVDMRPRNYLTKSEADHRRPIGPVVKRGRTTGITSGEVVDWTWSGQVRVLDGRGQLRTAFFRGQLRVKGAGGRPFSASGDSGGVVVERRSSKMIGLVIAGSTTSSIVTPAWRVLNVPTKWKVDLVPRGAPLERA